MRINTQNLRKDSRDIKKGSEFFRTFFIILNSQFSILNLFVHEAADAALGGFGEGLKADLEAVYCGVGGKLGV